MKSLSLRLLLLAALVPAGLAQPRPRALVVASIDTGTELVRPGVIVFHKGRILAIGAPDKVKLPAGTMNVPLQRFCITPGIVDANNQRGADGNFVERATRLTPGFSAADVFDPFARGFREALIGGVTHRVFTPDGGGVLAGTAVLLSAGDAHQGVALRREAALFGALDPAAYRGDYEPSTRSQALRHVRRLFARARDGRLASNGDYRSWRPDGETLSRVLAGKLPLALRAGSAGDVLAALALFEELKLHGIVLGQASALRKVLPAIKRAGAAVVLDPLSIGDGERDLRVPARMAALGIPFAFSSRAPRTLESGLLDQAALAVLHGLAPRAAWRALTAAPADFYRLPAGGKLAAGGDASFLIFAGDPDSFTAPLATPVWRGQWDGQRLMRATRMGGR